MAYHSETVAATMNKINQQYFLPAIQREFVWTADQIIELFDSVMRGYPVGSFLYWDLLPENRDRWDVYRFVDDFKQGGSHNQIASTVGTSRVTLVLDGQQRLTAFLLGLKGSFTVKKPRMWWDNPDAWVKQRLYLDLFQDPKGDPADGESGVRYGFRFMAAPKTADSGHRWLQVGKILDFDSEDRFEEFVEGEVDRLPDDSTKAQVRVVRQNLTRLFRSVWKDEVVASYTEHDQDYDRVLDIFVRANEGGTKLSKSDLLLSMVTSKWQGTNARQEIYGFVDHLNNGLLRKNNLDKDFVMKSCLVLLDLPVQYLVKNFNNPNLLLIEQRWPDIKSAIERTVRLVNSFGIDRDTLTSANALIPLGYYLFHRPGRTMLGTSAADALERDRIRTWFTAALLLRVFGGHSDTMLAELRRILQQHPEGDQFPMEALNAHISKTRGPGASGEAAVDNVMELRYGQRETSLALSLLYEPEGWGTAPFHLDHIFPRSFFDEGRLIERGYDSARRTRYRELMDRLGNLQLLVYDENTSKSATDPETWLTTRDPAYRRRHLIPADLVLDLDSFEEFVLAREALLRQQFRILFGIGTAPE